MTQDYNSPVVILLGSNLGNREQILKEARQSLNELFGYHLLYSRICITPPWGFSADQDFFNQVAVAETWGDVPEKLLDALLRIEENAGRHRSSSVGYSSRTLDLDILYMGSQIIHTPRLRVPHPRIAERRFTLEPLCELLPHFKHPVHGMSNTTLLEQCADPSQITWKVE
jgi:2-amino-4-hydroxy-6-hydroxymethyldihydropteridine diphosphokinase